MADVVNLTHPAAIEFLPRRGRKPRLGFVPVETPVEIVSLPHGAMPRSDVTKFYLYDHDGSNWYRIPGEPWMGLVDYARNWVGRVCDATDLGHARHLHLFLARTPLLADTGKGLVEDGSPRADALGAILSDGRERAAEDTRRYVASNLRACGDSLYVRARGPFAYVDRFGTPGNMVASPSIFGERAFPVAFSTRARAPEVWDFLRRHGAVAGPAKPNVLGFEGLHDGSPDDDTLHFCNAMPPQLAQMAIQALRQAPAGSPEPDRLRLALAEAMPFVALGMTGCVRREEAVAACDAVANLETELDAFRLRARLTCKGDPGLAAAYAREIAIPDLSDALKPADELALQGLGTGF